MYEAENGRFMNPGRAPQLYESTDDQAGKYFDYAE